MKASGNLRTGMLNIIMSGKKELLFLPGRQLIRIDHHKLLT